MNHRSDPLGAVQEQQVQVYPRKRNKWDPLAFLEAAPEGEPAPPIDQCQIRLGTQCGGHSASWS